MAKPETNVPQQPENAEKTEEQAVRYPEVTVRVIGGDANAFRIMGLVSQGLRKADVGKAEVDAFIKEATSGDYDHLLRTVLKWVSVR